MAIKTLSLWQAQLNASHALWTHKWQALLLYVLLLAFFGTVWFLSFDYFLAISDGLQDSNERIATIAETMSAFQERVNQVDPSQPIPTDVVAQRQLLNEQLFYLEQQRNRIVRQTFHLALWLAAAYILLMGLSWSLSYRLLRQRKQMRSLWRDWVEFGLLAGVFFVLLMLMLSWLASQFTVQNTFDPKPTDTILLPFLLALLVVYGMYAALAGLRVHAIGGIPGYLRRIPARTHGRVVLVLLGTVLGIGALSWLAAYLLPLSFIAAAMVLLLAPLPVMVGRLMLIELVR